jgi:acyl carrier protein
MERSEIQDLVMGEIKKVKKFLPDKIPYDDNLIDDWGFQSIDMAELVARAEQFFQVEVPDAIWKELNSVNKIADFIYGELVKGKQ